MIKLKKILCKDEPLKDMRYKDPQLLALFKNAIAAKIEYRAQLISTSAIRNHINMILIDMANSYIRTI